MGTPYSAVLTLIVSAGVLNLLMGLYALSGRSKLTMVRTFFAFSLLAAIYTFGSALELASGSLEEIKFWIKFEYLGMPFLPPLNLLIIMSYLGMERYLGRRLKIAMFIIPAVTLLLVMTNDSHHLYYRDIVLRAGGSSLKADVVGGPWYIIQGAYTFGCMIGGVVLLLRNWRRMPSYRFQLGTMLIGLVLPLAGDFLYLGGLTPEGMDPIPVIMTVTSALYLWALVSKGLFHVAPIARDKLFASMRDGVLVLDRDNRLVDYNPAAGAMIPELGVSSIGEQLEGLWEKHAGGPLLHYDPDTDSGSGADIQELYWHIGERNFNYQIRTSVILNQGGQTAGRLIVLIDVTEKARLQEELRQLAYYDGLTRIYNRVHFMKLASGLLYDCLKQEEPMSLLLFDIDHFKRINDEFGHDTGDDALMHIVAVCREQLRPEDVFGRYGGEEFVVALPGLSPEEAAGAAERIRASLALQPLETAGGPLSMTVSFGAAGLPAACLARMEAAASREAGDTGPSSAWVRDGGLASGLEDTSEGVLPIGEEWPDAELRRLLKMADRALYDAKRAGRDTVRIAAETS
ncbi:histidine kinase N-terminal 7TM domain-containing diguanylate cyclase [Paenibacillus cellulositrophicus]|uniref:histidine kinase N-terminal 7TM domain-containing diguanylate cyclase n=1 Tax=Paenibacillus cellulositrophicus TaxID=562959 RepID=UPI0012674774|nr:histidine kinase N-terminal 7TM domain-containing protein [Paenibacillus cellulositrophicus]